MTEKLRQSLSAVIDDEADAFELRRVLDELGRDEGLRTLWDRYHLIGNALRGERARLPADLRDRIWQAMDAAPEAEQAVAPHAQASPPTQDPAAPGRSRLGRYTGLAVAASVAFAVVLGFNGLGSGDDASPPAVAASGGDGAPVVSQPAVPDVTAGPGSRVTLASEVRPSDVQRAQAYMLHHAQQQALNQAGVMSFVKLATYEAP